jgi:lipopolysaccharide export system permease protein
MRLYDGWRYEERGENASPASDFIRIGFKEYKKQFDISLLSLNRTSDTLYRNNEQMRNMQQLGTVIDSLEKNLSQVKEKMKKEVLTPLAFINYVDNGWQTPNKEKLKTLRPFADIPDSIKGMIDQRVLNQVNSVKQTNDFLVAEYDSLLKDLHSNQIEWHRKIALSMACLVLFLIGAPLGSIIRKGGLGTPLIFAIGFFMVFYFLSNTGQKFAKEGSITPFTGMWLSTFVLIPIGVFLTYKALRDSQLFNKEFYFRLKKDVKKLFHKN